MSRRKVYDAIIKLQRRIKRVENKKDHDDLNSITGEIWQGIYGWEQDIKQSAPAFGIRNPSFPGDMVGWLDDDLNDDDEENDKK